MHYRLDGAIGRLRIPAPAPRRRAERLWEHTCCELFFAPKGAAAYREFNFSPSGEWAAYAFERYRVGGALPAAGPDILVRHAPGRLQLEARVAAPAQRLCVGLCAVIEADDGTLSYWALRHPGEKPDFHRADAFVLELA